MRLRNEQRAGTFAIARSSASSSSSMFEIISWHLLSPTIRSQSQPDLLELLTDNRCRSGVSGCILPKHTCHLKSSSTGANIVERGRSAFPADCVDPLVCGRAYRKSAPALTTPSESSGGLNLNCNQVDSIPIFQSFCQIERAQSDYTHLR